eukprot:11710130-Karenia_brevis.AAC.1
MTTSSCPLCASQFTCGTCSYQKNRQDNSVLRRPASFKKGNDKPSRNLQGLRTEKSRAKILEKPPRSFPAAHRVGKLLARAVRVGGRKF